MLLILNHSLKLSRFRPWSRTRQIRSTSSSSSSDASNNNHRLPTLTLYTKDFCPLCDKAKWDIKQAGLEEGRHFELEEVDIEAEGNERWWDKYKHGIPVFKLDGRSVGWGKIDLAKLKEELEKKRGSDK